MAAHLDPVLARQRAHEMTGQAVREGLLDTNRPCCACGKEQAMRAGRRVVILHHPDYSRPLYVIPLCRSCHSRVHGGSLQDPGRAPDASRMLAWMEHPAGLERALRMAASSGYRPRGMTVKTLLPLLAERGLADQFEQRRAARAELFRGIAARRSDPSAVVA